VLRLRFVGLKQRQDLTLLRQQLPLLERKSMRRVISHRDLSAQQGVDLVPEKDAEGDASRAGDLLQLFPGVVIKSDCHCRHGGSIVGPSHVLSNDSMIVRR